MIYHCLAVRNLQKSLEKEEKHLYFYWGRLALYYSIKFGHCQGNHFRWSLEQQCALLHTNLARKDFIRKKCLKMTSVKRNHLIGQLGMVILFHRNSLQLAFIKSKPPLTLKHVNCNKCVNRLAGGSEHSQIFLFLKSNLGIMSSAQPGPAVSNVLFWCYSWTG